MILTASGLTFVGGTDDFRFRAFATATGEKLWEITAAVIGGDDTDYLPGRGRTSVRHSREHRRRADRVGSDQ